MLESRKAVYHLRHTSSPFSSGYFGDGGLMNYLPKVVVNHNPTNLIFPSNLKILASSSKGIYILHLKNEYGGG
jgi:hypothetical protein